MFGIFEICLLVYIPFGTYILNKWRDSLESRSKISRLMYLAVSLLMAIVPLQYVRNLEISERSGIDILLAGICFFWFAIVGSREPKEKDT